jgi:hypothetical protein
MGLLLAGTKGLPLNRPGGLLLLLQLLLRACPMLACLTGLL